MCKAPLLLLAAGYWLLRGSVCFDLCSAGPFGGHGWSSLCSLGGRKSERALNVVAWLMLQERRGVSKEAGRCKMHVIQSMLAMLLVVGAAVAQGKDRQYCVWSKQTAEPVPCCLSAEEAANPVETTEGAEKPILFTTHIMVDQTEQLLVVHEVIVRLSTLLCHGCGWNPERLAAERHTFLPHRRETPRSSSPRSLVQSIN